MTAGLGLCSSSSPFAGSVARSALHLSCGSVSKRQGFHLLPFYLVYTRPNEERKACGFLQDFGYEFYFPQTREQRRHARKIDWVTRPFLPRYVFVPVSNRSPSPLRNVPGVSDLVRCGFEPVVIRDVEVEKIRSREVMGYVQLPKKEKQPGKYAKGDAVVILPEPGDVMGGLEAAFQYERGEDRAMVFLASLGKVNVATQRLVHRAEWEER